MITRSRRAALNSSSKSSSSSNSSFNSPSSTSKHNNNINNNNVILNNPDTINGIGLNFDHCNNSILRRSSRRLTTSTNENFTGLVSHDQQPPPNGNTIEDIVKDVVGNIVDYVSEPGLKESLSSADCPASFSNNITTGIQSKDLSSSFLHCNESSIFNQQSSPSSNSYYPGNVDCNEFDESDSCNQIEAITCEVLVFDVDMSEDDCGRCPVCGLYGRLGFEGHLGDRLGKVCSKTCVDKLQINGKACVCVACGKRIASDSQGYLANFGAERSTLCSEECLLKFERENEPLQKCYSCKKEIQSKEDGNLSIFYWQTMEFCSPECIENLQQFWGKKCANCDCPVPQQSLGKYSVRFGNVIKQFCHGSCLEQYKKAVKVCAYCQVNLSGCMSTCTSVTGSSSTKRIREFCDPICRSHYLQMVSLRNSSTSNIGNGEGAFSSPAVQCCQCSRIVEKSSCLDVIFRGRKFLICSTFCLSAFKFSFDVTKIICESCSKYGWSSRSANILHYSGFTKIFCSRKCLQMHVLKIRRIQSCLTCNVKKYNFDLVEKYDSISGDSKLFCSTFCYSAFEHYESQSKVKDSKSFCDWCRKLARLPFHIPSPEKTVRNFCTYSCVLAHQRHESSSGQFGFDNMIHPRLNQHATKSTIPTSDSTFKQPGTSSSIDYRQSQLNLDNRLSKSNCGSDLMRSTGFPSSSQSPPVPAPSLPSSPTLSPSRSSSSSSSFSPSLPFVSSFSSNTINGLQRSYPTRSKTLLKHDGNGTSSATSSTRPLTHHDHNLNTKSTVPSPFFNNNNLSKKGDNRYNSNDLSSSTGLQSPSTSTNHKNLGLSSPYILDASSVVGNVADKSTMWQPSRRSKATLCRPVRKSCHTQTDVLSQNCPTTTPSTIDENGPDDKATKYIPVPIFVPFFVPIPIPVPIGMASLFPLPLPTPIPFGFPIDSRLTSNKSNESIDNDEISDDHENLLKDDVKSQQQSSPSPCPSPSSPHSLPTITTTTELPKINNSKETNRKRSRASNRSHSVDSVEIKADKLSSEYQQTTKTSDSKTVKPVRLKRNAQDYPDRNNFNQNTLSGNNNNNNDNNCDDSDNCSNTSSSDDREKTKRRRVTISTHG